MIRSRFLVAKLGLTALLAAVPISGAAAQITLSSLVIDLSPGNGDRQDVEVANTSADRAYVAAEPAEIVNPGTPQETRRTDPDPEKLGLLVAPSRMILEPGQRKLLRIGEIAPPGAVERVYRITVKPVAGPIASATTGLKLLVGYDVLVLVRPAQPQQNISATRSSNTVTFHNEGNVSVEMADGRQCDSAGNDCSPIAGKRLYAGAQWSIDLKPAHHPQYSIRSPGQTVQKTF